MRLYKYKYIKHKKYIVTLFLPQHKFCQGWGNNVRSCDFQAVKSHKNVTDYSYFSSLIFLEIGCPRNDVSHPLAVQIPVTWRLLFASSLLPVPLSSLSGRSLLCLRVHFTNCRKWSLVCGRCKCLSGFSSCVCAAVHMFASLLNAENGFSLY